MARGITATLSRGPSNYKIDPRALVVIGEDTDDKSIEDHYLWRKVSRADVEARLPSIKELGVQKEIWATREKVDGKDRLVVVDGCTRTIAAREAKLPEVPVRLVTGEEAHIYGLRFLANLGGHGETPLSIARAAQYLSDRKKTPTEIAGYLQIGVPMLRIYLALPDMHKDIISAVEAGEMSVTAASKLATMSLEEQKAEFDRMKKAGELTVAAANAARAAKTSKRAGNGESKPPTPAPKKRILRKLIEDEELRKGIDVPKGFWDGLKFSLGDINPKTISGMSAAIREAGPKKRETAEGDAE